MTGSEDLLLSVLRDALWGRAEVEIPPEVYKEAEAQRVLGLIEQKAPYQQLATFVQYIYDQEEVIRLFSDAGIPMAIIKGTAAAIYYPQPYRRSMGDYDLIVPPACFTAAWDLLEENGYKTKARRTESTPREVAFYKEDSEYELHYRFSDYSIDIDRFVEAGLQNLETGGIDEHQFPMLPKLANGLVLLSHISHHLHLGLGLRQIIDWMMYCDKVLDDAFWEDEFKRAADEVGLTALAITATALCQKYLGLRASILWCRKADETLVDQLMETVMTSGNFGGKQGRGNKIQTTVTYFKREGFFRYLQHAGECNWRAYHRHTWLKPVCWIYQIFRYIKQGAGRGRKLKEDIAQGNQRFELLERLGID